MNNNVETYDVMYRNKNDKAHIGWELLNGVIEDRVDFIGTNHPVKSFLLMDYSVVEFPMNDFMFKYPPARDRIIRSKLQQNQITPITEQGHQ